MTSSAKSLGAFLDAAPAAAFVEVADAKGSTPREQGAWMIVSPGAIYGTIGGGQLGGWGSWGGLGRAGGQHHNWAGNAASAGAPGHKAARGGGQR